jgi:hypothetical protein
MGAGRQSVVDPDGREVVFDAGSRLHLALSRPALLKSVELILAAVESPDFREMDPRPGRERFYRRHVLDPMRWLLERDGQVTISWPAGHLSAEDLSAVLRSTV